MAWEEEKKEGFYYLREEECARGHIPDCTTESCLIFNSVPL